MATLGLEQTLVTRRALLAWADSEGVPDWYHNWLATSLCTTGCQPARTGYSEPYYPTFTDGVRALSKTLQETRYTAVVAALQAGNSMTRIWNAVNQSPWCNGCQTGKYPAVLYEEITATNPVTPLPPPAAGPAPAPPLPSPATVLRSGTIMEGFFEALLNYIAIFSVAQYDTMQALAFDAYYL